MNMKKIITITIFEMRIKYNILYYTIIKQKNTRETQRLKSEEQGSKETRKENDEKKM